MSADRPSTACEPLSIRHADQILAVSLTPSVTYQGGSRTTNIQKPQALTPTLPPSLPFPKAMDYSVGSGSAACPIRTQSRKRTFSNMAAGHRSQSPSSSLFVPHDDHYNNEHAARRFRISPLHLPSGSLQRFPGDGFDYRRPVNYSGPPAVANSGNNNVIDLTDDDDSQAAHSHSSNELSTAATVTSSRAQRLPRYDRDIIDIVSDEEENETPHMTMHRSGRESDTQIPQGDGLATATIPDPYLPTYPLPHDSTLGHGQQDSSSGDDDVELITVRPATPSLRMTRSRTPAAMPALIDLTAEIVDLDDDEDGDEDDGLGLQSPAATGLDAPIANILPHDAFWLRRLIGREALRHPHPAHSHLAGNFRAQNHHDRAQLLHNFHARRRAARHHTHHGQPIGGLWDYQTPGFDLDTGRQRPPSPKYSPPVAAPAGFTRSPDEDEIVVCPNCGDELAMGEGDIKQQIWVIKACGHAYCGECAQNRYKGSRQSSKKGKARAVDPAEPLPFKQCVVDGCTASASQRSMIHVYLGS